MRLSGSALTAWQADNLSWTMLAEARFADGTVYLWKGPVGQSVTTSDGQVWSGADDLVEFDKITESMGAADPRTKVKLLLDSTSDVYDSVIADSAGRELIIYTVVFDSSNTVVHAITNSFIMGEVSFETETDGATISEYISMELISENALLNGTHVVLASDQEQQRISSGDRGLQYSADPNMGNRSG